MRIKTERLILRPLHPDDVSEAYVGWLNDPAVNRFLETRHAPQTEETVREFIVTVPGHLFGIFRDGQHVGNIKIGPVKPHHSVADVSLLIGREFWGKGYAQEAIRAMSAYAFSVLGVRKLSASMYRENYGSAHAFEKAGYKLEGSRDAHYLLDGQLSDLLEYGLVAPDYQAFMEAHAA